MSKACDKCGQPFKGFGTTCGSCRKAGKDGCAPRACEQCGNFFVGAKGVCNECSKGSGLGRTGVRLPTGEEVDGTLNRIDACIQKVDASQQQNVRLRKAETDLLVQLEIIRDVVQRMIESKNRSLMMSTFGDCGRVARLESFLSSVKLSEVNAGDTRYKNCKAVLDALSQVVESDFGGQDQLNEARARAEGELMKKRISFLMDEEKVAEVQHTMTAVEQPRQSLNGGGDYASAYEQRGQDEDDQEDDKDEGQSDWSGEDIDEMSVEDGRALLEQNARTCFDSLDEDKNGELTREEFQNGKNGLLGLLRACKVRKGKHVINMFTEGDTDGNGTISFDEFLAYIRQAVAKAVADAPKEIDDDKVLKIFNLMDRDGDGSITRDELKMAYAGVLLMANEPVDSTRVSNWANRNFKKYDEDGSGTIDVVEFKKLLSHSGALRAMLDFKGEF